MLNIHSWVICSSEKRALLHGRVRGKMKHKRQSYLILDLPSTPRFAPQVQ